MTFEEEVCGNITDRSILSWRTIFFGGWVLNRSIYTWDQSIQCC